MTDDNLARHQHLRQLTSGRQHQWTSASSPVWSPCGKYVAFLSDRKKEGHSAVWILPATAPGEARLLREFPLPVGDLTWSHDAGGIIVSASIHVDQPADAGTDAMEATAKRDKELADKDGKLGGLNAVLFQRLPVREWDKWLTAKMAHPFFVPVRADKAGGYTADAAPAVDLLSHAPTAVPSGAFGGSEDWSISSKGAVAVSARPPVADDEAWTTNRHIYLKTAIPAAADAAAAGDDMAAALGVCLTSDNPGYDTTPTFSPDGSQLAWLTMAGGSYESDAVGIRVHDLSTGETRSVLEAEVDWAHSPNSLCWSDDGKTIYFTADVRSRQALCSVDVAAGATGITVLRSEGSSHLHAKCAGGRLLTSIQSLTMPSELFSCAAADGGAEKQLTYFNTETVSQLSLGRPGEMLYEGAKGEEVQAWLIRPAGFSEADEEAAASGGAAAKKFPLAVLYHGGPQGSSGDDWHYRWNLQYYASMGFAVLAPNFHGSTGFGHEFCREISGNWEVGGLDTIAGVTAAIERYPWIDADKVVGLGASYGGFTSNWLNGNAPKGMFKALVCHCGTFDLRSSYYATEELFFMETEFNGPPFTEQAKEAASPYNAYTPSTKVSEWKTPTLVIHGAKDFRLVESEGLSTFCALQRQGVPSELLYLPSENHHCLNPQNSMVWHEAVLRWIREWTA